MTCTNKFVFFFPSLDSKPIRLQNGTSRCSGRVEILHEGNWGTVCDDKWGMQEVAVVCRQLNCGTPIQAKYKAYYGRGEGRVWLDDVECRGKEKALSDCPKRGYGDNNCDHDEDAGVVCSGNKKSTHFTFALTINISPYCSQNRTNYADYNHCQIDKFSPLIVAIRHGQTDQRD